MVKTFKLHNRAQNGKAKNVQAKFKELPSGELVPRDPSFPIAMWEGKAFKKSAATEVKG